MSETEHIRGTLTPYPVLEGESLLDTVNRFVKCNNRVIESTYINKNDPIDIIENMFYREAIIINNTLYEVEKQNFDYDDVYIAHRNKDGKITFELVYYNGGCSFSDAIKVAIKNMKE